MNKFILLCAADEKQSNVAFCGRVPKAPLTDSFEKLCLNPSSKLNSQTSCFLFLFFTTSHFVFFLFNAATVEAT